MARGGAETSLLSKQTSPHCLILYSDIAPKTNPAANVVFKPPDVAMTAKSAKALRASHSAMPETAIAPTRWDL